MTTTKLHKLHMTADRERAGRLGAGRAGASSSRNCRALGRAGLMFCRAWAGPGSRFSGPIKALASTTGVGNYDDGEGHYILTFTLEGHYA